MPLDLLEATEAEFPSPYGKTFQASSATAQTVLDNSLRPSSESPKSCAPPTAKTGQTQVWLMDRKGKSLGGYSTQDIGECPKSGAVSSSLAHVLVSDAPAKYFLSARAAAGMLKRSEKRTKKLPEKLRRALVFTVKRREDSTPATARQAHAKLATTKSRPISSCTKAQESP